ncbi:putative cop9 signalosome complex subunit 3 protein [Zalerion maritima]|uniref:Cop9 signalosome complex subunit 3 protein n=1 Tax=Zalerion maritima TaxID=339359 RepID=A0AAD5RH36_9PEZI|nr:putative cop9 signalosome complex subunit 3 protein [Zalerion maritima]
MDPYPFPPPALDPSNNEKYHQAIKAHSDKLISLANESKINYNHALKSVDPAKNSISFLALLVFASENPKDVHPAELSDHIIRFLVSFDPRQVRYGGPSFINICNTLLTPHLSSIAIDAVAMALQKLDPSGSVLTLAHVSLVETAVRTYDTESISLLDVISKKILFYPGMLNQVPKGTLAADMSLPAPHFMTSNSGLNPNVKPSDVIRYDYFCGMIYLMRRDWQGAYDCWMRCATHPSKDGGVSQVMVNAYKKLSLMSLLLKGRAVKLPSGMSGSAKRVYDIMGKPYTGLAALFEAMNAKALIKHANDCQKIWDQDQNLSMVTECLASYQKWKIIDLRDIYTKVFLSEVRSQTQSAITGQELASEDEVEELVTDMISSGMLRGHLGTTDGSRTYLEFLPENPALSEEQYYEELVASSQRLKLVEPLWRMADDRVSTSKEHIKHLVRMEYNTKKRGNTTGFSAGFMDPGFEDPMEDEDLMGDSY